MEDAVGMSSNKRPREEVTEEVKEARRRRESLILEILESDEEILEIPGELTHNLEDFMKRFVEDIGMVPSCPPAKEGESFPSLGFLFEASDDELGLPPTVTAPSEEDCLLIGGVDGFDGFFEDDRF